MKTLLSIIVLASLLYACEKEYPQTLPTIEVQIANTENSDGNMSINEYVIISDVEIFYSYYGDSITPTTLIEFDSIIILNESFDKDTDLICCDVEYLYTSEVHLKAGWYHFDYRFDIMGSNSVTLDGSFMGSDCATKLIQRYSMIYINEGNNSILVPGLY